MTPPTKAEIEAARKWINSEDVRLQIMQDYACRSGSHEETPTLIDHPWKEILSTIRALLDAAGKG
jgi:hypothetical protein